MNRFYQSAIILLAALLVSCTNQEKENQSANYTWKNVTISGGGFVPGIIFHPTEPGVRYCRTDMGGAYRWDEI